MNGRLRVYVTGGLQRSTGRVVVRQALSSVLPKKKSLLKLKPSGAPLVAEREIRYTADWAAESSAVGVARAY